MIALNREQLLSLGALGALLIVLVGIVLTSLQTWSDAAAEFNERSEILSRLEVRAKSLPDARARKSAPPAAFLDAPTQGLAVSQLQAHLLQTAGADQAVLVSAGALAAKREDPPDTVRLQATLDSNLQSLQTLLYHLESGTPYVFVESLAVQIVGAKSEHAEDPQLRISLALRALWRRSGT
jgi:general secretion pathway protein M